jgi:hypothetical protein
MRLADTGIAPTVVCNLTVSILPATDKTGVSTTPAATVSLIACFMMLLYIALQVTGDHIYV